MSRGRRPREGALCCKMVQCVLSWARGGVLVACGCAGVFRKAQQRGCEGRRPAIPFLRRRARARAAPNARFRCTDAAGALCGRTAIGETPLRCGGAAQFKFVVSTLCASTEQPEGMTLWSYLRSRWRYGRWGVWGVAEGCVVCVGTSERGSRCAFVVGCRRRLPRHARWTDDSSPRPLASLEIPAASDSRAADRS